LSVNKIVLTSLIEIFKEMYF